MDDLLIRGATVIDGTGGAPRSVDVAVRDGRISAVEMRRTETAAREVDGTGRVLAPGFIDIHTHSDFTLPLNRLAEAKVRQGVTTEVVGNCGFSVAPALPGKAELLADYLSASAPWLPFIETDCDADAARRSLHPRLHPSEARRNRFYKFRPARILGRYPRCNFTDRGSRQDNRRSRARAGPRSPRRRVRLDHCGSRRHPNTCAFDVGGRCEDDSG